MDPLRGTLLWASGNATLREHLPRFRAVRKTVERFMPGETAEDGLNAAQRLATEGLPATFTLLGENVDDMSQAAAAAGEYLRLLDRIDALGLDAEVSVKLTQLGFDLEPEATMVHMERLADRSADMGRTVWIDMESSAYVDGTIDLYASLLARSPNSGLCLQAYLHRTWDDVQKLAPMSPTIRLVKGAYREPKDVAFQDKRLIDESYFRLASHLVTSCRRLALGTHDTDLVARIEAAVPGGRDAFEVAMLYGIRVGRATPVGAGRVPRADVDRVRPVLVPVVHAADRREAGREHAPRAEERAVTPGLHGAIAAAVTPLRGRRPSPGRGGVRPARPIPGCRWCRRAARVRNDRRGCAAVRGRTETRRRVVPGLASRRVPGRGARRSADHGGLHRTRGARARGGSRRRRPDRAAVLPARPGGAHSALRVGRGRVRSPAVLHLRVRRTERVRDPDRRDRPDPRAMRGTCAA